MKIGNFTKTEDGRFVGRIQTLSIEREVQFVPETDNTTENAPEFRILSMDETVEYGAGWLEESKAENAYISAQFDDPLASAKIYAALTRADEGYSLFWSRPKSTKSRKNDKSEKGTL